MEISDLENIEMEELNGKEEVIKSIRFSKDEFYMLKCCKVLNKRFATFIKELINDYINEEGKKTTNNIDIEKLKNEIREELREDLKKEILEEVLEKLNTTNNIVFEENKELDEDKKVLFDILGSRK